MTTLGTRNVRDEPRRDDGHRVLVDRLWPRGLARDRARLDDWFKHVAPSDELRRWFGHDPRKFEAFRRRYRTELDTNDAVPQLQRVLREHDTVTLLHGARDPEHNNAAVLLEYLREHRSGY